MSHRGRVDDGRGRGGFALYMSVLTAVTMAGMSMAIVLRHLDIPPRIRYTWEDEPDDDARSDPGDSERDSSTSPPRTF